MSSEWANCIVVTSLFEMLDLLRHFSKRLFTGVMYTCRCGRTCINELQALAKVQRFSVAVMFLSSKDKIG